MVPGVVGSSPISHPTRAGDRGFSPVPAFIPPWGRSQAVRQGTLTPSCAGSSPAVPASSEIPLTAPFPARRAENCAGREISSLLQGGAGSPLSNPHPCGGRRDREGGRNVKPSYNLLQNPQILKEEKEQTERSEACSKGGIHEVQFVLTTTR